MKKELLIFFLFSLQVSKLSAQGYADEWVLNYKTSLLDFRIDTVGLDTIQDSMVAVSTLANICDTNGNLLFYTNGVYINDRNGNMLENGDWLNPCEYTFQYFDIGLGISQAAIFLPKPGSYRYYYLIHFSNDTDNGNRPATLLYSVIDAAGNGWLGTVVQKNIPFFKGAWLREGGMTACKHANGRDWWIVMPGDNDNTFYKFLLTPDTILGPFVQNIGPVYSEPYDWGYDKFSQDGSKFAVSCAAGLILIVDFDRCSGEFSNPITIFNNVSTVPNQPESGAVVEFSPSGRFIYATSSLDLVQYDLLSDNVQDSILVWTDSDTDFYKMHMLQVAPNGKIYGSTYNGGLYALHVINYPDLLGASCGFVYGGQPTLTLSSSELPNMINYNLGALQGSPCDTIPIAAITATKPTNSLRLLPNPADKYLYVEMGMQGNYKFDLLNEMGQLIARKETRQIDVFDTEGLASGIYFLKVTAQNTTNVLTQKVVVQH